MYVHQRNLFSDLWNMSSIRKGLLMLFLFFFSADKLSAQASNQMVRLAKIKVDPKQLDAYNAALKEQMHQAMRTEPGVLKYYAMADKKDPSSIVILEIYADTAAYNSHIQTIHFKKYKELVKNMVKSLELTDVTVIADETKPFKELRERN